MYDANIYSWFNLHYIWKWKIPKKCKWCSARAHKLARISATKWHRTKSFGNNLWTIITNMLYVYQFSDPIVEVKYRKCQIMWNMSTTARRGMAWASRLYINIISIIRPAKKSIIKGRRFNINANGHFKAVRCIYAKTRHFLKHNGDLEFLHL